MDGTEGKGTKQCIQQRAAGGTFVNHGKYIEWHPNGKRALEGEYDSGQKSGKWVEWDEEGKLILARWFDKGVETPRRDSGPAPTFTPAPAVPVTPAKPLASPIPASSTR